MFNGLHYNSISSFLKERFDCKVVKLSLDAHLTCPNRDGSKGYGGCTFCSQDGSGSFAGSIEEQLSSVPKKWTRDTDDIKYIAYFQNHTNTYADPDYLRRIWNEALDAEGVVGLAIATRPDCLGPDILDLLEEFNKKTFLWVELGLQTSFEETAQRFNRCWKNVDFENAMMDLSTRAIKCVIHLILGLPGEDKSTMMTSARYAASFFPFGIKIHMLHLMKGTVMGDDFIREHFPVLTMDEYVSIVCDILEIMPRSVTVHRLTGDAPQDQLIAPDWTRNKHSVLNAIQKEFKRRGSFQGSALGDAL